MAVIKTKLSLFKLKELSLIRFREKLKMNFFLNAVKNKLIIHIEYFLELDKLKQKIIKQYFRSAVI